MDPLWILFALAVGVTLYALPMAIGGLFAGRPRFNDAMPPMPPTREQSRRRALQNERRARYFEDTQ